MKKNILLIVLIVVIFLLATATNFSIVAFGGDVSVIGFIFSILYGISLVVLPLISKNKRFINVLLVFMIVLAITSIWGLLKSNGIITSDFGIPIAVIMLTPFGGFEYILTLKSFYLAMIIFSLVGAAVLLYFLRRNEPIKTDEQAAA